MSTVADKLAQEVQRQTTAKQVRLQLVYIDFWSAVKLSFLIWLSLGIVLIVAFVLVWIVLNRPASSTRLNEPSRHPRRPRRSASRTRSVCGK